MDEGGVQASEGQGESEAQGEGSWACECVASFSMIERGESWVELQGDPKSNKKRSSAGEEGRCE